MAKYRAMKCLDITGELAERAYPILAALVVPRPIAWVSTLNDNGTTNLAPFSFFNVFGDSPPLVIFAPGDREDGTPKDTALNCQRRGEFVVHLVSEAMCTAMARSAAPLPYGESEAERESLAWSASTTIATPRLRDAPAALECTVHEIRMIGENRLVFGLVQRVWVDESLWDENTQRVMGHLHHPVGRMAVPDRYCHTNDQFVQAIG